MEQIIRLLLPFFIGTAVNEDAARADILETLAAYGTRTRAEVLIAAQIIAFSMSALDTLAEAKSPDLSPSMRIRFRGCANGLNRSTQQTEKALDQRLAADPPTAAIAEPTDDMPDHQAQSILEQTAAKIDAARPRPKASPTRLTNQQLWASAMVATLQKMGVEPITAPTG